jgi:hypothetical protein
MENNENFRTESKKKNNDNEAIMKWFDKEVEDGENAILVYPHLEALRQIYADYVKRQLLEGTEKGEGIEVGSRQQQQQPSTRRIILVASFYETVDSIKHHLSAFGVENIQKLVDNGSLVLVDSFHSFFPDVNGMKKLIDSLSEHARKEEGRDGVTAIVDMGSFFLFGGDSKAADLIKYEASLAPKIQDGNVKGISCYHMGNYETLTERDKEQITQGQRKKLLEVTELQ